MMTPQAPSAQFFTVRLRSQLSKPQRRRFWRGMRIALTQRSLVLAQHHGLCVVLAVGHHPGAADRRHVVNWLLDQTLVSEVIVQTQLSLEQILGADFAVDIEGGELEPELAEPARRAIRCLIAMALRHHAVMVRQASEMVREMTSSQGVR